jgi:hypothetical protein
MTNSVMPIQLRLGAFDARRKWTKLLAMTLHAKALTLKIVP